jgi:universal stress protein A
MRTIQKILCPVDFSPSSDEALEYALQLAVFNQAHVHLLHVLPQINYYDWNTMSMYALISDETFKKESEHLKVKLQTLVSNLQSRYPALGFSYEVNDTQNPADGILHSAQENKADLIVIGSHGRRGLDRLLMGSVAESVMRHAECAVMIFKQKATDTLAP